MPAPKIKAPSHLGSPPNLVPDPSSLFGGDREDASSRSPKGLASELGRRALRYLTMVTRADGQPTTLLANRRGFIADGVDVSREDPSKAWVRLRTPSAEPWEARARASSVGAAAASRSQEKRSVWTDDPVARLGKPSIGDLEDVNVVSARFALARTKKPGAPADEAFASLPPPIYVALSEVTRPAPTKTLVRIVRELRIPKIDAANIGEGSIDEQLRDAVTQLESAAGVPHDQVQHLTDLLNAWLGALPIPVPTELTTNVLERAFDVDLAKAIVTLRESHPHEVVRAFCDRFEWMASLGDRPLSQALPELSDHVAFGVQPARDDVFSNWRLAASPTYAPPPPAPPGSLVDGDSLLYRCLAFSFNGEPGNALRFRSIPAPKVPSGWVWPTADKDSVYWWNAILLHHCVRHMLALKDTADFHATDLLRFVQLLDLFGPAPPRAVPSYVRGALKATFLSFKYWFDEPATDAPKGVEMTFWSENHQIQFHAAQFLVGQLFPDEVFLRSGTDSTGRAVTGREHMRRGRERLERWLDRRLRFGFSEWNSPGYYNEDFPPLVNVADFSQDASIATKASMVLDILIFDLARSTCRGSFGVTAGRAYAEHKCYGWAQSVGETIEVLFGSRGDHLDKENTAIALVTAQRYRVPPALLAIGRDRTTSDRTTPLDFRSRVSVNLSEGAEHGIGFQTADDLTFWWGLGAYFLPETIEGTRHIASTHPTLRQSPPMNLLWRIEDALDGVPLLGDLHGPLRAVVIDTAEATAGATVAVVGQGAASMLAFAPPPISLLAIPAGAVSLAGVALALEGLVNLIGDIGAMIFSGLESAWAALTGDDPPEPEIPESALQSAWEAMLTTFNGGSALTRANIRLYSVGDAMLSSVQNHRVGQISAQKQSWMASLGCDACVFTSAPMVPGGSTTTTSVEVVKHLFSLEGMRAVFDVAAALEVGADDIRDEGLRPWGGSICLPKVVQHQGAAIIAYEFGAKQEVFSSTPTHAWFPCEFFDEVVPAPVHDGWLPERGGGGTWVFGRKDDGYVALCSARKVRWVRDDRFRDDPDPLTDGTIGQGRPTFTELLAENGSNIWVCAIGNRERDGAFASFCARIEQSYLHFSGVGELGQLQCTFDRPAPLHARERAFRLELFFDDNVARVDGTNLEIDEFPRFEGPYVRGRAVGRVDWGERRYTIHHDATALVLSHDLDRVTRTFNEEPPMPGRVIAQPARGPRTRSPH